MYKFSISGPTSSPIFRALSLSASLVALTATSAALAQDAKKVPEAAPATEKAEAADKKDAPAKEDKAEPKEKKAEPEAAEVAAAPKPPTEEEIEEARTAFEAGTAAFEKGKFTDASVEFEKAYATIPSPHAEYWLATSLDNADGDNKKTAEVVAAYEKFLSNSGKSHVGADKVSASEARVVELKKLLPAKIKFVTTPVGAIVTIDGVAQEGVTPLEVELSNGAHKVEVALEGHERANIELNALGGSSIEQQVTLIAIAAPPVEEAPPVVEEAPKNSVVPAVVTLSIAGAGLITGTIFGIMALNSKGKFNDNPNSDDADAAERNALIADMSFGIAITLGVTGVVLLTAHQAAAEEAAMLRREPRFVVAPYGGPDGGGAKAQLKF